MLEALKSKIGRGGRDGVCTGHVGEIPGPDGEPVEGAELRCPDGNGYRLTGDEQEVIEKAKESVLPANCNDDTQRCEEEWAADLKRK